MTVKQISVRLPRLLDKDLSEVCRLRPRAQTIEQNITPLSTASLTLDDRSGVAIRSFVELYTAKGSAGVFRVSMPDESYGSGERITLEHGICALDDAIINGKGEITGTPASVLSAILSHQTTKARGKYLWTLGKVDAPNSKKITIEHDGTKTLEMLAKAMSELEGYMLTFDQSVFPWVVNVVKKPEKVSCEGRLSRNIRTIRKTMDDSDLCTRLYCSLLDGGYIESDTVSAWGVVEKSITLNDDMPKDDAKAYCRRYLDNRKNPTLSLELDATEWYVMTGERLDRFEIGDICRVALPEYGVIIEERIVALNYMDALGMPEAVTVSLANRIEDISFKTAKTEQNVSDLQHTSTGYGNRLTTTETSIAHLKEEDEEIKKVNGKFVKWFAAAEINLDATEEGANVGILATYEETYGLFSDADKRIAQAELILHGEPDGAQAGLIARVTENEREIASAALILNGTKDNPSAGLVAKVGKNESGLKVFQDSASIQNIVDGKIVTEINASKEGVTINAAKINLNGYVTASQFSTEIATLKREYADYIETASLSTQSLGANYIDTNKFSIGGTQLKLITKSLLNGNTTLTVDASGGTVTGVTLNKKYTELHFLGYD